MPPLPFAVSVSVSNGTVLTESPCLPDPTVLSFFRSAAQSRAICNVGIDFRTFVTRDTGGVVVRTT